MTDIRNYIEHTLLKQDATKEQIIRLCDEALKYRFLGICIPPLYVKTAHDYLKESNIKIVTVVGFPLGSNRPDIKAFEAEKAILDGADEIDMVACVSLLKNKDWDLYLEDIETVKKVCQKTPLKVIIETDLLSKDEIAKASLLCIEAKADFVKTSTGFVKNGIGAKVEDIELISKIVKPHGLQVKASGGIKNKEQALALIKAGADRLGTSSGVQLID